MTTPRILEYRVILEEPPTPGDPVLLALVNEHAQTCAPVYLGASTSFMGALHHLFDADYWHPKSELKQLLDAITREDPSVNWAPETLSRLASED